MMKIIVAILVVLLVFGCLDSSGAKGPAKTYGVTAAWNENAPEDNVVGYRLYYGTSSGIYEHVVDVANNTTVVVSGLSYGNYYYFAVTAYNETDESDFSEEVSVIKQLPGGGHGKRTNNG